MRGRAAAGTLRRRFPLQQGGDENNAESFVCRE